MVRIINTETKQFYYIELHRTSGEEQIICPVCSHERKKKRDKCFSWNHNDQVGFCHHCNASFAKFKEFIKPEYKLPEWKNNTELSDKAVKYLEIAGW